MPYLNKHKIIGNIGREGAKIVEFQNNGRVAEFSVATHRPGRNGDKTLWHKVKVHSERLIDTVIPLLRAGTLVYVEGENEYDVWRDKDGVNRKDAIIEIRFDGTIQILSREAKSAAEKSEDLDANRHRPESTTADSRLRGEPWDPPQPR